MGWPGTRSGKKPLQKRPSVTALSSCGKDSKKLLSSAGPMVWPRYSVTPYCHWASCRL
jgi:hypothetical protein